MSKRLHRTMRRGGRRGGGDRGIGGGGQLPPFFSTLALWWRSDLGVTESGGVVSSWEDQIAGVTVASVGGGQEPTISADPYFKGKPALEFSAGPLQGVVDDPLMPTALFDAGNYTVIVAARVDASPASGFVELFDFADTQVASPDDRIRIRADEADQKFQAFMVQGGVTATQTAALESFPYGGYQIAGVGISSTQRALYSREFGTQLDAVVVPPPLGVDTARIGGRYGGNDRGSAIAEILVFDHLLTAEEFAAVQTYLDSRYLPVDVPLQVGVQWWWKPEEYVAGSWVDSMQGVELAQATGSQQPTPNQFNTRLGHESVTFDRTNNQHLRATDPSLLASFESQNPVTVYVETVTPDAGIDRTLLVVTDEVAATTQRWQFRVPGFDWHINISDGATTANRRTSQDIRWDAASWVFGSSGGANQRIAAYLEPDSSGAGVTQTLTGLAAFYLGANFSNAGTVSNHWDGDVGHVLVFQHQLTDAQHQQLQAWLESLWANVALPIRLGASYWWQPGPYDPANGNWTDSIAGVTLSQATPASRPAKTSVPQLGGGAVVFDGVDDSLESSDPTLAAVMGNNNPFALFLECVPTGPDANRIAVEAYNSGATTDRVRLQLNANGSYNVSNEQSGQTTGAATSTNLLVRGGAAQWLFGGSDATTLTAANYLTGEATGGVGTAAPATNRFKLGGSATGTRQWVGAMRNILLWSRFMGDAEREIVEQWIQDQWTSELPVQLGADIWLEGDDATVSAWPDRMGGPDFAAIGSPTLATINGRQVVDLGGVSAYSRDDATADSARTSSTQIAVVESAGGVNDLISHHDSAGTARVQLTHVSDGRVRMRRVNGATTVYTGVGSYSLAVGNRYAAIASYRDADGAWALDTSGESATGTTVQAIATAFDRTTIGARDNALSTPWSGKIAAIIQIPRYCGADERQLIEDWIHDRWFNWEAQEGEPGAVDDVALRYRADQYNGASGNWPAKEGSLKAVGQLSQATASLRPTKNPGDPDLGGQPTAEGDGSDLVGVDTGTLIDATEASYCVVGVRGNNLALTAVAAWVSGSVPGVAGSNAFRQNFLSSGAVRINYGDSGTLQTLTTTETVAVDAAFSSVAAVSPATGEATITTNGVRELFTGSPLTPVDQRSFAIIPPQLGSVAELVLAQRRLGDAEAYAWRRYCLARYLTP